MRRLFKILGILVLAGTVLVTLYVKIAGRDIPRPDFSDLKVERVAVSEEENAFSYFQQAVASAQLVDDWAKIKAQGELLNVIARNREMMNFLEQGVAREICQVPEVTGLDTPLTYISKWMDIGIYLGGLSDTLYEAGRISEAVDCLLLKIHFSQKIASRPETLLQSFVGVASLSASLERLRVLVIDPEISSRDLERLEAELLRMPPPAEMMSLALKAEFNLTSHTIEKLAQSPFSFSSLSILNGGSENHIEFWQRIPLPGYCFQPNRTRLMFASAYRSVNENFPLAYSEMNDPEDDYLDFSGVMNQGLNIFLVENGMGNVLYHILLPGLENLIEQKLKLETRQHAVMILIALQQYQRSQGAFPETLDKLVPEYLPEIPRDPFDGDAFKYDLARLIIYAVGENLIDDRGSLNPLDRLKTPDEFYGSFKTEDVVFQICLDSDI